MTIHLSKILNKESVDVTIFVPCYNEEDNVVSTLDKIVSSCTSVKCNYEIIVIDDNSTDHTLERLTEYQRAHRELPLQIFHNRINQGLAYNFLEAAIIGRGEYIRIVCGDDVEPIETQVAILSLMGQADVVLPYHDAIKNKGWFRTLLSRSFTKIINLVSGYRLPYWNGCGLFKRRHVLRGGYNTGGFGFQAMLLYNVMSMGATYVAVRCHYNERKTGKSKALSLSNLRSVAHAFIAILGSRIDCAFFRPRYFRPELVSAQLAAEFADAHSSTRLAG